MIQEFAIGLIGDALIASVPISEIPLGPLRISHAAPSGAGNSWTAPSGARSSEAWQDVLADEALHAILLTTPGTATTEALTAGLAAGKTMFCSAPPATDAATLRMLATAQKRGGGVLLCPNIIANMEAGKAARHAVRAQGFGVLRSAYVAARAPFADHHRAGEPALARLGWEALDYVLSCVPGAITRVHATGGRLFCGGSLDDAFVAIVEARNGTVITAEISWCLPGSGPVELEFDLVGSQQALRLEPLKSFHVTSRETWHARPLLDPPAAAVIAVLAEALRGGDRTDNDLDRQIAVAELFEAIGASVRSRTSVELGTAERLCPG